MGSVNDNFVFVIGLEMIMLLAKKKQCKEFYLFLIVIAVVIKVHFLVK